MASFLQTYLAGHHSLPRAVAIEGSRHGVFDTEGAFGSNRPTAGRGKRRPSGAQHWAKPGRALRHPPSDSPTGWYTWCGEGLSDDPGFFALRHVEHLSQYVRGLMGYLAFHQVVECSLTRRRQGAWFDSTLAWRLTPQRVTAQRFAADAHSAVPARVRVPRRWRKRVHRPQFRGAVTSESSTRPPRPRRARRRSRRCRGSSPGPLRLSP